MFKVKGKAKIMSVTGKGRSDSEDILPSVPFNLPLHQNGGSLADNRHELFKILSKRQIHA